MNDFDIIVIGGGHAGVEAALAAVRMGHSAAIITMSADKLALMSCNPAIGGIGKSQIVKEVDALGGLMGQAIDATGIQFRRLNLSRGPAVWSTRAQADRVAYNEYVVQYCQRQERLEIIEALADEIVVKNLWVAGVRTDKGELITSQAVIVATGTFLGGLIHIGDKKIPAGRLGEKAANRLSESFRALGFEIGRLKTGTPPRLDGKTVNWEKCQLQPGDSPIPFFSYRTKPRQLTQTPCHITRTTAETKRIISAHFHDSPIFSGQIGSKGPRYCPSIEDKFYRFADKPHHQLFLEPEGNGTDEVYPNGFSTALPEDIQQQAIRTVIGLEEAILTRPGYAVEYDYCPACQIRSSLETHRIRGLFLAGQINGTSGYEEAAGQGIMAGINAALCVRKEPPFVLDRSEAYLAVMIDDLVTRSTTEPYRMFTSRAEYRLALREDNARDRLFDHARKFGLIGRDDYDLFRRKQDLTINEIEKFRRTRIKVAELKDFGKRLRRRDDLALDELIKQPNVEMDDVLQVLARFDGHFTVDPEVLEKAIIQIRYEGYIAKQEREIEKFKRMESETIPDSFDWQSLSGIKQQSRETFSRFRPATLGQAGRLEGVSPGDIAVLSVFLKRYKAGWK